MPLRSLKLAKFINNYFIFIPIIVWLCTTLFYTMNANIYADDATLLDDFERGNPIDYLGDFFGWVPGRNLTILFQYLLFQVSFATTNNMIIYHLIAQAFYILIAVLLGRLIFNFTRGRLTTSMFVALYLLFPTNIQILNWSLSVPQHILPTLFSILTITYLTRDSKRNSIKVSLGLLGMIFTYDQSAALAIFLILFILSGLNIKMKVFDFNPSWKTRAFWVTMVVAYFFSSFFGRKALGVASNLSDDSLNRLIFNFLLPFRFVAREVNERLSGLTIVLVFIFLLGFIYALQRVLKQNQSWQSVFDQKKNRLGIFFILASIASFFPAALWYPDKRHFFLPATLLLMGFAMLVGEIKIKKTIFLGSLTSLALTLALALCIVFQNSELRSWESRDHKRKLLYIELLNQSTQFPEKSIFLIDDLDPNIFNLFYAERMQSAYKYYNNNWKINSPRIYQLSRIDNLQICTAKENANTEYIRINLVDDTKLIYTFTPERIDKDCLWNIFL